MFIPDTEYGSGFLFHPFSDPDSGSWVIKATDPGTETSTGSGTYLVLFVGNANAQYWYR